MTCMKDFFRRYKHGALAVGYLMIYLIWFFCLEDRTGHHITVIHTRMDDLIPFCEVFIIPYLLWFGYVALTVLLLLFRNKQEYYQACLFLFTGMTIFLVISTFWPNGHYLRPATMPRDNIFTSLVAKLYLIDTPTNLWPSIHVYNSLGAHFAITRSRTIGRKRWVRVGSLLLCTSIILSTMFLKQHSTFDVITALILAAVMYHQVYYRNHLMNFLQTRLARKRLPQTRKT